MKPHVKNRRDSKADRSSVRGSRGGDRATAKRAIQSAIAPRKPVRKNPTKTEAVFDLVKQINRCEPDRIPVQVVVDLFAWLDLKAGPLAQATLVKHGIRAENARECALAMRRRVAKAKQRKAASAASSVREQEAALRFRRHNFDEQFLDDNKTGRDVAALLRRNPAAKRNRQGQFAAARKNPAGDIYHAYLDPTSSSRPVVSAKSIAGLAMAVSDEGLFDSGEPVEVGSGPVGVTFGKCSPLDGGDLADFYDSAPRNNPARKNPASHGHCYQCGNLAAGGSYSDAHGEWCKGCGNGIHSFAKRGCKMCAMMTEWYGKKARIRNNPGPVRNSLGQFVKARRK